jgi:hypothetical protein
MDPRRDQLVPVLAEALRGLLDYVEGRPEHATADDDVTALEDAAASLLQIDPDQRALLIATLGDEHARIVGLIE